MQARRGAVLLVAVMATCVACSSSPDLPPPVPLAVPAPPTPVYDGSLEPAAAVLALVPEEAASVTVTDLTRIRIQLGDDELTGADDQATRDAFWTDAATKTALLTGGLLRPVDAQLESGYGFSEDDVDWEAHFFDKAGTELGWVLRFRDDLDLSTVQRAVTDKVGPLADGSVDAADHLVTDGTTPFPKASWAADQTITALVGLPANSTYLQQGCLPGAPAGIGLEPLKAYSMAFGAELATARLGGPRTDLFTRLGLDPSVPGFADGYTEGVADPTTGRLGYQLVDPAAAAQLALSGQLPFAACADSSVPADS